MLDSNRSTLDWFKRLALTGVLVVLMMTLSAGLSAAWWDSGKTARDSGLPSGNAITDGKALLRYALPIDNQAVREMQADLEDISIQLRSKRWSAIASDVSKASRILSDRSSDLLAGV
ncbi:peptidylprolyl isomerase, partial [Coleofasciculus sp. FACHB-712]|nr:peptidylprolyl isomerase [Coleofasciculus sp. FACHB-712]